LARSFAQCSTTIAALQILGCKLDPIDTGAAVEAIAAFARERRAAQVVTLGTEMVVYAQRDAAYRGIVNRCALSLCDTVGLLAVARARGATLRERVTGVELVEHLCERAVREGFSVFLFGGAPGVAQAAAAELQRRYPGLTVAGSRDGYFAPEESAAIAAQIRASGAHLLFAGIGFPKQEFWLAQYLQQTGCGAGIGVGGSFDVIGGKLERAPESWRRLNLEWLYRLVREPRRWKRQLALPYFVLLVAGENVRRRLWGGKT
jgi:N-acetylglucosaminyldiphosphoundecaprenol N-acetyl-beta-D-mannosaminyltransferase